MPLTRFSPYIAATLSRIPHLRKLPMLHNQHGDYSKNGLVWFRPCLHVAANSATLARLRWLALPLRFWSGKEEERYDALPV